MMMKPVKTRDSNIEGLRMLLMLFILVLHAMAVIFPDVEEIISSPGRAIPKIFIEALTIVSVNVFILISGWYGINLKLERLLRLVFQTFFFSILLLAVLYDGEMSARAIFKELVSIFTLNQYWFIKAYILLCLLAPVFNTFAEHSDERLFRSVLVLMFIFQTIFGFINNTSWYEDGYSPLTFFFFYLLARYLRLHPCRLSTLRKEIDILLFLVFSLIITGLSVVLLTKFDTGGRMFNYLSPLVVASSVHFFLFFTKFSFQCKFVNWISSSCLAVYLLHMSPYFLNQHYFRLISQWHSSQPVPVFIVYVSGLVVSCYIIAILLDKVRILFWSPLKRLFIQIAR